MKRKDAARKPKGAAVHRQVPVLLIDDDEGFRSALAENLRNDGYNVLEYGAADQVPSLHTLGRVKVVLSDYEMPRVNGVAFADSFHAVHPRTPVVILTAHPQTVLAPYMATRDFLRVLQKPVDYSVLQRLLDALAATYRRR